MCPRSVQRQDTATALRIRRWSRRAAWIATGLVILVWTPLDSLVDKPTWPQLVHLADRGRTTQAVATAIDPANHGSCTFRYTVASRTYHGENLCGVTTVGADFTVTYDPDNPTVVTAISPSGTLINELELLVLVAVIANRVLALGVPALYRWLVTPDDADDPSEPRDQSVGDLRRRT